MVLVSQGLAPLAIGLRPSGTIEIKASPGTKSEYIYRWRVSFARRRPGGEGLVAETRDLQPHPNPLPV